MLLTLESYWCQFMTDKNVDSVVNWDLFWNIFTFFYSETFTSEFGLNLIFELWATVRILTMSITSWRVTGVQICVFIRQSIPLDKVSVPFSIICRSDCVHIPRDTGHLLTYLNFTLILNLSKVRVRNVCCVTSVSHWCVLYLSQSLWYRVEIGWDTL